MGSTGYGYEGVETVAVGVGGAATWGIFSSGPVVCPVVAEIQQLVLPFRSSHQVRSALRPTIVTYDPWAKDEILS